MTQLWYPLAKTAERLPTFSKLTPDNSLTTTLRCTDQMPAATSAAKHISFTSSPDSYRTPISRSRRHIFAEKKELSFTFKPRIPPDTGHVSDKILAPPLSASHRTFQQSPVSDCFFWSKSGQLHPLYSLSPAKMQLSHEIRMVAYLFHTE